MVTEGQNCYTESLIAGEFQLPRFCCQLGCAVQWLWRNTAGRRKTGWNWRTASGGRQLQCTSGAGAIGNTGYLARRAKTLECATVYVSMSWKSLIR